MKTSLRTRFASIRPVLMSFHADQIQAETAFCSSGQFSLRGPDKSRHCTITSHKSVSVPQCAEWMHYWTGAGEKEVHTYTQTRPQVHSRIGFVQSCSSGLIIRWAWGWCLVLMWTGETVWYCCCIRLWIMTSDFLKSVNNVWVEGSGFGYVWGFGLLGPVGRRCNCITWS